MSDQDEAELAARLDNGGGHVRASHPVSPGLPAEILNQLTGSVQWATQDDRRFRPMSRTAAHLVPALYDIRMIDGIGLVFDQVPMPSEEKLRIPDTPMEEIIDEIARFWTRAERFREYGLPHKRGIMLWGDPGGGKSSIIDQVLRDVIRRGGVGFRFTHPDLFQIGMRAFRQIQPDTPAVVLMEDMDSIVESFNESDVLNLLDGAEAVEHVVFLASTNYPELLGARIMNRPSRFDRRFRIGLPTLAARRVYLDHMVGAGADIDVAAWAADTDGMSFAHLKELFVSVHILGNDYEGALKVLRGMGRRVASDDDRRRMGLTEGGLVDFAAQAGRLPGGVRMRPGLAGVISTR